MENVHGQSQGEKKATRHLVEEGGLVQDQLRGNSGGQGQR